MTTTAPIARRSHAATTPDLTALADLVAEAGLTGRGGAAFPTAVKIRAAQQHRAGLVVNACDGERGAGKDAWIVEHALAELVEGATLLAGGRPITWAAHRGSATLARLKSAGLHVLDVPARHVSSEETALLSLMSGGLAKPMTRVAPFVQGGRASDGRRIAPTVVHNAETVWRVAQIWRRGADWFRGWGTATEPGPRLVTVVGAGTAPCTLEAAAGMSLSSIITAAGGMPPGTQALLIGGLGGALVPADRVSSLSWTTADLATVAAPMGPGVIEVVAPGTCPLGFAADLLDHAAGESAGQCGPCMFGLPALADAWRTVTVSPNAAALHRLQLLLGQVPGRGACKHPDGTARLASSALQNFSHHLDEHRQGYCSARSHHALVH